MFLAAPAAVRVQVQLPHFPVVLGDLAYQVKEILAAVPEPLVVDRQAAGVERELLA